MEYRQQNIIHISQRVCILGEFTLVTFLWGTDGNNGTFWVNKWSIEDNPARILAWQIPGWRATEALSFACNRWFCSHGVEAMIFSLRGRLVRKGVVNVWRDFWRVVAPICNASVWKENEKNSNNPINLRENLSTPYWDFWIKCSFMLWSWTKFISQREDIYVYIYIYRFWSFNDTWQEKLRDLYLGWATRMQSEVCCHVDVFILLFYQQIWASILLL